MHNNYYSSHFRCASYVGMQGGPQLLFVGVCNSKAALLHELGHTIGFFHEHSRLDRDNYIRIMYQNIHPRYEIYFAKHAPTDIDSLGVPYDYDSIMHYSERVCWS